MRWDNEVKIMRWDSGEMGESRLWQPVIERSRDG